LVCLLSLLRRRLGVVPVDRGARRLPVATGLWVSGGALGGTLGLHRGVGLGRFLVARGESLLALPPEAAADERDDAEEEEKGEGDGDDRADGQAP